MRADEYVRICVYPSKGAWVLAVLRSRTGRPYPRLVGKPRYITLASDDIRLSKALELASDRLRDMSEDLHVQETAAKRYGAPSGGHGGS